MSDIFFIYSFWIQLMIMGNLRHGQMSNLRLFPKGFHIQFSLLYYSLFSWGYSSDHSLFNWYLNIFGNPFLYLFAYYRGLDYTIPAFFFFCLLPDLSILFKFLNHSYFVWKEIKIFDGCLFYFLSTYLSLGSKVVLLWSTNSKLLLYLMVVLYAFVNFWSINLIKRSLSGWLFALLYCFASYIMSSVIRISKLSLDF